MLRFTSSHFSLRLLIHLSQVEMLWHWACILFCAYCISLLLEERFELAYEPINKTEKFHYLVCFDLRNVANYSSPEVEVDLDQLNDDVFEFFVQLKSQKEVELRKKYPSKSIDFELFNRTFLMPIRSREYLIYRGYVPCRLLLVSC